MENMVLIAIILVVVLSAILYIDKQRKKGVKCIGCPCAKECAKKGNAPCTCNTKPKDFT